jgi:hypothetical protein
MRGIKTMTGLRILAADHAFVQNLRRGHYEIAAEQHRNLRLPRILHVGLRSLEGQSGTTLQPSVTDLTPDIDSSDKPPPGPCGARIGVRVYAAWYSLMSPARMGSGGRGRRSGR